MERTDKQIAAQLVRADAPKLSTQDVADYLDIKAVTLRSWVTRGYVELVNAERGSSGRGKSSFFSPLDVVQLMACAMMTRFSIAPGFLTARFSKRVMAYVLGQLHLIAETPNYAEEQKAMAVSLYDTMIAEATAQSNMEEVHSLERAKHETMAMQIEYRYIAVAYSPFMKDFMLYPVEGGITASGGIHTESIHLAFDCLDLADRLIRAYRIYSTG